MQRCALPYFALRIVANARMQLAARQEAGLDWEDSVRVT